jgi:hypothetical protein
LYAKVNNHFAVTVLVLLTIGQLFNLLTEGLFIANAQSSNSANLLVPSNMNRMEITLKNDESPNPISIYENPLLIALISGLSAILGGVMGSYMTNRSNIKLEEKRHKIETEREVKLQAQEERKKESIRALMCDELQSFSEDLGYIDSGEFWTTKITSSRHFDYQKRLISLMESYKLEYLKLPFEMKLALFDDVNLLMKIQSAYDSIESWRKDFLLVLEEHKGGSTEDLHIAVKKIKPLIAKQLIDPAIKGLKEILPKGIVEKIESKHSGILK